ncbi:MAG: GNAT family N-acetyltransferase [Ferruginibacter sp.]
MISITKATQEDAGLIVDIGNISVEEAHRASCSAQDMREYLDKHYNDDAIQKELSDPKNIYYLLRYNERPVGFSKIVLNAVHKNIAQGNVTQLDRIYLLKEYQDLKLGFELLNFNIELARQNDQSGIWLFTWVGNSKAINFYLKAGFKIIGGHHFKVTENHYNENHQMFLDLRAN